MKKRILIFCDSYLPGFQGGGGMRAVYNFADNLCDDYDFFVITRDCDGKSDQTPYVAAARDVWNDRPEAKVFYASPSRLGRRSFVSLIREIDPDLIYLNSVFSYVCVKFLFARMRSSLQNIPVIVAPCGEFAPAALRIKSAKKQSFLAVARLASLFGTVKWKASNVSEKADIANIVEPDQTIFIASEFVPREILPEFKLSDKPKKFPGAVNLIFYARIAPIKNLLFVIEILKNVSEGEVNLDVVGPAENVEYFEACVAAAKSLPVNITVRFTGGKRYDAGLQELVRNHYMLMPTESENFGYVLIEAFAAGCPVISSDQIALRFHGESSFLRRIPLSDAAAWLDAIKDTIYTDGENFQHRSSLAREGALQCLNGNDTKASWKQMLESSFSTPDN